MSAAGAATPAAAPRRLARRREGGTWSLRVGAGIVVALVLVAVCASVLAPHDRDAISATDVLGAPTPSHPLGFDEAGRDVLSRLLYAYRVSLGVALGSVGVALLVGVPIGLVAGFYGRWIDLLLMRPIDMMLAFPALLLSFVLIAVIGTGVRAAIIAIAAIFIPVFARVVRTAALTVSSLAYVDAARARGASNLSIMLRHVLPNAIGPALVQASILAGIAIQIEAAISFVGLGVQPPTPSLGVMLADGRNFLSQAPWLEIVPGCAIAVSVLGFILLADGLRGRLDPYGVSR
jgi:peptide/nickel transport system permease protein